MRKLVTGIVASAVLALSANAQVLRFDGIAVGNGTAPIGNFYNGGGGPANNFGITFFGNALAINSSAGNCGGGGNFAQQPSGCGALFFLSGSQTGMNRTAGFQTGFSLFYTAVSQAGSVGVWSGLNGTGTLLATLLLPTTGDGGNVPGCEGTNFCPFRAVGIGFAGTAQSVVFAGVADQIAFDNITFGAVVPEGVVPEPSTYALMLTGLAGLAAARRRRASRN